MFKPKAKPHTIGLFYWERHSAVSSLQHLGVDKVSTRYVNPYIPTQTPEEY